MATNDELQQEIAHLRAELQQLQTALVQVAPATPERSLSRRTLLRAAPVAALGAGLAAMSATPAAAASGQPMLLGVANESDGDTTSLHGTLSVAGYVDAGTSYVSGADAIQAGVTGPGAGVHVDVQDGSWIDRAYGDSGVTPGVGLDVNTQTGPALQAASQQNVVALTSTDATASVDAVTVAYAGKGRGVFVESTNPANINGTITGVNDGTGIGVWGEARAAGIGVVGFGGAKGRGAQLTSAVAPLRLVPATASTHPTTGKAGDFFVDSSARLWFCQKASSGATAATWKQLA